MGATSVGPIARRKILVASLRTLPMITTSRLLLRPFRISDAPKLFVMSREDGLRRWLPDQVYRDQQHAEQVARALMAHTANLQHQACTRMSSVSSTRTRAS